MGLVVSSFTMVAMFREASLSEDVCEGGMAAALSPAAFQFSTCGLLRSSKATRTAGLEERVCTFGVP